MEPRLLRHYRAYARPHLAEQFQWSNPHEIPKIEKVVLNVGVGEASKNAKLLTSFRRNDVIDLKGDLVTVRFLGNGGYRRPYGRAALTIRIKDSEDHFLVVSYERGVNTFLNPDPTEPDSRSFRENVMQLEYVIRWRR